MISVRGLAGAGAAGGSRGQLYRAAKHIQPSWAGAGRKKK